MKIQKNNKISELHNHDDMWDADVDHDEKDGVVQRDFLVHAALETTVYVADKFFTSRERNPFEKINILDKTNVVAALKCERSRAKQTRKRERFLLIVMSSR